MTHEEARAELRALATRLRLQAINLEQWADHVGEIIAEAYPDATSTPREPSGARRALDYASRMSTRPDTRPHGASQSVASCQPRAAGQAGS